MLSKNQVKFIRSLQMKKFREIHQQFTAEGTKMVLDLLDGGMHVSMICATPDWISEHHGRIPCAPFIVTEEELARITTLTTAPSVVAVFDIPELKSGEDARLSGLVLVLDDIRDPGNLGTIIRIADWFGIRHIVCSESTVDAYNPKVVQATMGSIARVELLYTDLGNWLEKLPERTRIYGTSLDGENLFTRKLSASGVIVIGNESNGISKRIQKFFTDTLLIPSFADATHAESLNASSATAIVCAEFRRQSLVQ